MSAATCSEDEQGNSRARLSLRPRRCLDPGVFGQAADSLEPRSCVLIREERSARAARRSRPAAAAGTRSAAPPSTSTNDRACDGRADPAPESPPGRARAPPGREVSHEGTRARRQLRREPLTAASPPRARTRRPLRGHRARRAIVAARAPRRAESSRPPRRRRSRRRLRVAWSVRTEPGTGTASVAS